jgi:hypothetical protein
MSGAIALEEKFGGSSVRRFWSASFSAEQFLVGADFLVGTSQPNLVKSGPFWHWNESFSAVRRRLQQPLTSGYALEGGC